MVLHVWIDWGPHLILLAFYIFLSEILTLFVYIVMLHWNLCFQSKKSNIFNLKFSLLIFLTSASGAPVNMTFFFF